MSHVYTFFFSEPLSYAYGDSLFIFGGKGEFQFRDESNVSNIYELPG